MRVFVPPQQIVEDKITIIGDDVNHVKNVMRKNKGDKLNIFDNQGNLYSAEIALITKDNIVCNILETKKEELNKIKISLAQSIPKGKKLETVIQKATELGAYDIFPFISARTVPELDKNKETLRLKRWNRIAKESAEQCQSPHIPFIRKIINLNDIINKIKEYDLCLIPWEEEKTFTIKKVLQDNPKARSVLVIIGPEGGFTKEEVGKVCDQGAISVSLGNQILRTETAPLMVISCLNYQYQL